MENTFINSYNELQKSLRVEVKIPSDEVSVQENGELRGSQTSNYSGFEIGLTKREYFAAKAMQGLLSNPEWMKVYQKEKYLMQSQIVAEVATNMADECLKILSIEEVTEQ